MRRRELLQVLGLGASAAWIGACGSTLSAGGARGVAMAIDVAACSRDPECRACIDACHGFHNVPSFPDPAREVEWLRRESFAGCFADEVDETTPVSLRDRRVLTLCNHCERPPCTRVCPTGATWRREDGTVMMDEHRCIGCRYCMAACPYGARRFNWLDPRLGLARVDPGFPTRTAGVVEKCTFCAERCRAGLEPLCVEASLRRGCNAIHFGLLEDAGSPVVLALRGRTVLRRRPELGTGPHVLYLV